MEKQFGWALIGPGAIAHRFAEAVNAMRTPQREARLVAIQGRSLERANEFAKRWTKPGESPAHATTSIEALLARDDVDGVYIATPHAFHADAIRACLMAKKPVLCEKPMVTDAAMARELCALAAAQKTILMEAVWTRFLPIYATVAEWLKDQRFGALRAMQSSFCFNVPFNPTSRLFDPAQAGGALLDIGIYNITATRLILRKYLGKNPIIQKIEVNAVLAPSQVDKRLSATLHFDDDITSQFVCATDCDGENAFHAYGANATITVQPPFWGATKATLTRRAQPLESKELPWRTNGFEYEIEEAMACIQRGAIESEIMPHSETIAVLEIMDAIREKIGVRYPWE